MRISSIQIFNSGVQNMLQASSDVTATQQEVSSGKKLVKPSDDPVGATRVLNIQEEMAQRTQYDKNIDSATSSLNQEDSLLGNVWDTLQQIRDETLQAGNTAVLTQADRSKIAQQMQQQVQSILGVMNSRDVNNKYIFSGFKGDTVPFVQQGAASLGVNGSVLYQGDEGQRMLQTDSSTSVAVSDSGQNLFVNIPSATNSFTTSASPINKSTPPATISAGFVYDQTAYNTFYPNDMVIEFQNPSAVAPAQANYNVVQKSDGRVLQSNVLYTSGTPVQINGAQFTISGSPSEGDTFSVNSRNSLDMLTSINQLIDGLVNLPTGSASLQPLIDNSLTNIDSAQNNILQARSDIGARLNSLDNTKAQHADMDLASKQLLSNIQDADLNEAVSRLSFQSTILQAAQQSFAKVSQLSLFDKI